MNEYIEKYGHYFQSRWVWHLDQLTKEQKLDHATARERAVKEFAWAVPSPLAIKTIAKYSPIVEIGAGTGYWAYLLEQASAQVVCYDIAEPTTSYVKIKKGGPEVLRDYATHTLFLCWPPYDNHMAFNCLRYYKGNYVIYIGEGYGGCTADDDFHRELDGQFKCILTVQIPQWEGIHDVCRIDRARRKDVRKAARAI